MLDSGSLLLAMRSVDGSAVLVPAWLLRSVMLADSQASGTTLLILRGKSYGIGRDRLVEIIEQKELLLDLGHTQAAVITLLAEPEEEYLRSTPDGLVLRDYWRLLFDARVYVSTRMCLERAGHSAIRQRIERIGPSAFNDARFVLMRDRLVPPGADDLEVYARFAAEFLGMWYFSPLLLGRFFTAVDDPQRVAEVLNQDVNGQALLGQLRPVGAADARHEPHSAAESNSDRQMWTAVRADVRPRRRDRLERRAEKASRAGNDVHAAILRQQAGEGRQGHDALHAAQENPHFVKFVGRFVGVVGGGVPEKAPAGKSPVVRGLVPRGESTPANDPGVAPGGAWLQTTQPWHPAMQPSKSTSANDPGVAPGGAWLQTTQPWHPAMQPSKSTSANDPGVAPEKLAAEWVAALAPVLARSADSWRNAESRLLYDLQKVCTDHEKGVYALDAIGWLFTLGWRRLRRPVPAQAMVLTCKHLRSAAGRLDKCQLRADHRRRLEDLLRAAIERAQERMRDNLRPAVSDALDRSGLRPRYRVEDVAREKLVEEFLDGLVRRGYARMGDLRDTISRNQLKLHDLAGVLAFLQGDQLLQIDRNLGQPLDGVYHRGEAYLRFFQRVSSLLFATPVGRLFTYYCLMPFGGAFIILEVLGHTVGKLYEKLTGIHIPFIDPEAVSGDLVLVLLGFFLLGMVNSESFRRGVKQATKRLSRDLKRLIVDWRGWKVFRRLVEVVMASPVWRLVVRYGLKPAIVTFLAWRVMPREMPHAARVSTLLGVYGAAAVALNSRTFRMATYVIGHFAVELWTRLVTDLFIGLYRVIVRVFRLLLERLERALYAVDEWFRFRTGQTRRMLLTKATLGAGWGIVTYWLRFGVTLLLEPQINPIKHFPVVTVSHKIILPTVPAMVRALKTLGLGEVQAGTYATSIAFVTPGVFGFLAWELKENWRLYAANRSRTLRPVRMGSHGETLAQLLRPGIHSGTIPRIFARLRRAAMPEAGRRAEAALRKREGALGHTSESIRDFFRRELAGLLNRHPAWSSRPVVIGAADLAATRIRVSLECPQCGPAAQLSFEQHDGWIVAGIDEPGWMVEVSQEQSQLLGLALLGVYQMAGVDLVREQIEALAGARPAHWNIRGTMLAVWSDVEPAAEIRCNLLQEDASAQDQDAAGLWLARRPVDWECWRQLWDLPVSQWDQRLRQVAEAGLTVLPRQRRPQRQTQPQNGQDNDYSR